MPLPAGAVGGLGGATGSAVVIVGVVAAFEMTSCGVFLGTGCWTSLFTTGGVGSYVLSVTSIGKWMVARTGGLVGWDYPFKGVVVNIWVIHVG